jgi:hypothetical protein
LTNADTQVVKDGKAERLPQHGNSIESVEDAIQSERGPLSSTLPRDPDAATEFAEESTPLLHNAYLEEHDDEEDDRILSEIEMGILDLFSDSYCNKHLMYGALELILVRLMPELAEKGIIELWEERLS